MHNQTTQRSNSHLLRKFYFMHYEEYHVIIQKKFYKYI